MPILHEAIYGCIYTIPLAGLNKKLIKLKLLVRKKNSVNLLKKGVVLKVKLEIK
jgi:hypothetical protein